MYVVLLYIKVIQSVSESVIGVSEEVSGRKGILLCLQRRANVHMFIHKQPV